MAGIMWQSRLGESAMKLSNRTSNCCAQERKQAVNNASFRGQSRGCCELVSGKIVEAVKGKKIAVSLP
jgi:hypothetical protein